MLFEVSQLLYAQHLLHLCILLPQHNAALQQQELVGLTLVCMQWRQASPNKSLRDYLMHMGV
jgi:hypothetical protein